MNEYYTNLLLNQNQIEGAALHNVDISTITPTAGQVVFDTVSGRFAGWNGTEWVYLDNSGGGTGVGLYDFDNLFSVSGTTNRNNLPIPAGASGFLVTGGNDIDLTGIAGGVHNQVVLIFNQKSNKKKIKLKHNSSNSLAANRFLLADEGDWTIQKNSSALLRYDGTLNRWHLLESGQH